MDFEMDWKKEYLALKEYSVALEHTRADLMGVNEVLHKKIEALEAGQTALLEFFKPTIEQMKIVLNDIGLPADTK